MTLHTMPWPAVVANPNHDMPQVDRYSNQWLALRLNPQQPVTLSNEAMDKLIMDVFAVAAPTFERGVDGQ